MSKKVNIQLALLAFDKGGNPHRFRDLDNDKRNPDKPSGWYPCLFDAKTDHFLGPLWTKNSYGKSELLEATDLVRMKSYHWVLEQHCVNTNRNVNTNPVFIYLSSEGVSTPVPAYDNESLSLMVFK